MLQKEETDAMSEHLDPSWGEVVCGHQDFAVKRFPTVFHQSESSNTVLSFRPMLDTSTSNSVTFPLLSCRPRGKQFYVAKL